MNPFGMNLLFDILSLIVGFAIGFFFHRYQTEKALKDQQQKAESILKGASEQARQLASQTISIPISEKVESLNAGVAGAVLMFEVVRQRNHA